MTSAERQPQQPSFGVQATAFTPIFYWRGARPFFLDLTENESGWMICLRLQRDDDCCLMPLAWQQGAAHEGSPPGQPIPFPTRNSEALDLHTV
ncbi:MAG: hypothetical protein ACK2UK_15210, partial [Candidatus Promineifilaceae bacterium]